MGISGEQFWAQSKNGKAMVVFLCRRGDIELARDICEWLVAERRSGIYADAIKSGKSIKASEIVASEATASIAASAQGMSERNAEAVACSVVDAVFQRHYNEGKQTYDKVMSWFADEIRKRVQD